MSIGYIVNTNTFMLFVKIYTFTNQPLFTFFIVNDEVRSVAFSASGTVYIYSQTKPKIYKIRHTIISSTVKVISVKGT